MSVVVACVAALGIVLMYAGLTTRGKVAHRRTGRFYTLVVDAGFAPSAVRKLSGSLIATWLLMFLVAAGITTSVAVAASLATAAVWFPLALLRARADRRRRRFVEAWPDAVATLIAAVRAGVALPEACIGLTRRGPADLQPGFEAFAGTYRSTGSFAAGLVRLREEMSDPVADRVAVALGMAHEVGGSDLVRILRALSDFVREDLRVRKEVEARWSWTVTAARVAAAAPWVVLLLMSTRPEAAAAYDSVTGVVVIAVGAVATIIGYRLMLRAARLPEEPRLPL